MDRAKFRAAGGYVESGTTARTLWPGIAMIGAVGFVCVGCSTKTGSWWGCVMGAGGGIDRSRMLGGSCDADRCWVKVICIIIFISCIRLV